MDNSTLWLAEPFYDTSATTTAVQPSASFWLGPNGVLNQWPSPLNEAYDFVEWQVLQLQRELIEDLCRR